MRRLLSMVAVLAMTCMLAACGSEGGTASKTTSTVKSVDDVLEEQIAQNDEADAGQETDNAGKDDTAEGGEDVSAADTREIDAVDEKLAEADEQAAASSSGEIDVDLTKLSSTMVYSEVYNMMTEPEKYYGKKVRMNGTTSVYHDGTDGNDYYACVIKDATECCAQGIEFVLNDGKYPEANTNVTVTGTFSSYKIGDYEYYTLVDAAME